MTGQRPKKQFRMGRIVASIFDQPSDTGTLFNVSITRLYKPDPDKPDWERSTSFNRDDLPIVAKVADQAWTWIHAQQQAERQAARETSADAQ